MIKRIGKEEFIEEFKTFGRFDQFEYEGLSALFDWLEDMEDEIETECTLDVIGLCCEFTLYEDFAELQANYSCIENMDDLYNHTTVIPVDNDSFIIADF